MWYTAPLQKSFSFASYWRDPTRLGMYRELSPFLADINNERAVKNQSYVDRITSLTHFVLVMSRRDTIIVPRESSWFGFYRENSTRVMQTMEETPLYREDWLGLKRLRESGRAYNPAAECDTQHTPSFARLATPLLQVPHTSRPIHLITGGGCAVPDAATGINGWGEHLRARCRRPSRGSSLGMRRVRASRPTHTC